MDVAYKMIYEKTFFSFCPKHNTLERKKSVGTYILIYPLSRNFLSHSIYFSPAGKKVSKNAFLKRKYARTK